MRRGRAAGMMKLPWINKLVLTWQRAEMIRHATIRHLLVGSAVNIYRSVHADNSSGQQIDEWSSLLALPVLDATSCPQAVL